MTEELKRESILQAALVMFGQYGFRRTSMQDIAQAAGISRPALYLLFRNKEDIFRSAAEWLQVQACEAAEQALDAPGAGSFEDRIQAAVWERVIRPHLQLHQLPHVEELMALNGTLAADISQQMQARSLAALARFVASAAERGEADLSRVALPPQAWVEALLNSLHGVKAACPGPEALTAQVQALVRIFCAGIRAG